MIYGIVNFERHEMMKFLLANGARINERNERGESALTVAASITRKKVPRF